MLTVSVAHTESESLSKFHTQSKPIAEKRHTAVSLFDTHKYFLLSLPISLVTFFTDMRFIFLITFIYFTWRMLLTFIFVSLSTPCLERNF